MNLEDLNVIVQDLINRGVDPKAKVVLSKDQEFYADLEEAKSVSLVYIAEKDASKTYHHRSYCRENSEEGRKTAVFIE